MRKYIKIIFNFILSKNIFLIIRQIIENNSYIELIINNKETSFFAQMSYQNGELKHYIQKNQKR